jgi:uncharacterized protein (TIGR03118 family)
VKHRIAFYFASFFLAGFLFASADATGQTIGYRQTHLAASLPSAASSLTPNLTNPWGITFLSGQPFFVADNTAGRVTVHDATGLGVAPSGFTIPNISKTGSDHPTGIVADQNSSFGNPSVVKPFILVTEEGTILTWGPDPQGNLPEAATLVRSRSSAVYKGATILNSLLSAPALAVTDFHQGFIETFLPGFTSVALAGSFTDPNLLAGYAPFGIQVIGSQVFVTYAVQDAAKHDPVVGAGNGIVSIFDMDGNFVRRFATGGALNAPRSRLASKCRSSRIHVNLRHSDCGDSNLRLEFPLAFSGADASRQCSQSLDTAMLRNLSHRETCRSFERPGGMPVASNLRLRLDS